MRQHYALNKTKYLSKQELDHLNNMLVNDLSRDSLLIKTALYTGARAQELLNINKTDIDHENQSVLIKGIKGSNDREVPLPKSLYNSLCALASNTDGERLFNISYPRLVAIWNNMRPCKKTFHSLRHTCAIELYSKTRDLRLVKTLLGHRQISNTMIYADYLYQQGELKRLLKVK